MPAELGRCGCRRVPAAPQARRLRAAPLPSEVAPLSPHAPLLRGQPVTRHTLLAGGHPKRLSRPCPPCPGTVPGGNATSAVSALPPEPARAAASAGRAWETAGRPPPGHTSPCPRPPQGHAWRLTSNSPPKILSMLGGVGNTPSTGHRPPASRRLEEEGAGGESRAHLPRPCPALSSAHCTDFAGEPVCRRPSSPAPPPPQV